MDAPPQPLRGGGMRRGGERPPLSYAPGFNDNCSTYFNTSKQVEMMFSVLLMIKFLRFEFVGSTQRGIHASKNPRNTTCGKPEKEIMS